MNQQQQSHRIDQKAYRADQQEAQDLRSVAGQVSPCAQGSTPVAWTTRPLPSRQASFLPAMPLVHRAKLSLSV